MGLAPLPLLSVCWLTDTMVECKANARSLGIDPERIIVGGGSAGGNIVSQESKPITKPD